MSYIGDIKLGNTFDTKFTTRQISGAPTTLSGVPVISNYVGNGTTELTAGITLTVDFDARTGLNNVRVVATSGNGYATATDNQLVITTGTVNSVSVVGEVIAEYSIENRRADVQFWNGTQVATPATAGIPDVNTKNINNVAAATPGASGGILISGSNSGTTTLAALTITGATTHTGATVHTGNVSYADGLTISAPSTGNRAGLSITGNGTGAGIITTGGATGIGLSVVGGGTSGDGIKVTTTSGHGINLAPVGTSMHGLLSTGGNGGTSDGIKAAAGTGGVDLRAAITGNITGNLSGSVGSLTTNNDKTGYSLTQTFPTNFSALAITVGGAVTVGTVSDKTGYSLVAGYDLAKTAAQAGDAMALTGGERTTLAGVINTTAIVESYRANGAVPTPAQFMSEVLGHLGESSISGTTKTVKKFDHSTTAATFTLDSATTPAAITRAT